MADFGVRNCVLCRQLYIAVGYIRDDESILLGKDGQLDGEKDQSSGVFALTTYVSFIYLSLSSYIDMSSSWRKRYSYTPEL